MICRSRSLNCIFHCFVWKTRGGLSDTHVHNEGCKEVILIVVCVIGSETENVKTFEARKIIGVEYMLQESSVSGLTSLSYLIRVVIDLLDEGM